jgi:hypothetical protein
MQSASSKCSQLVRDIGRQGIRESLGKLANCIVNESTAVSGAGLGVDCF